MESSDWAFWDGNNGTTLVLAAGNSGSLHLDVDFSVSSRYLTYPLQRRACSPVLAGILRLVPSSYNGGCAKAQTLHLPLASCTILPVGHDKG